MVFGCWVFGVDNNIGLLRCHTGRINCVRGLCCGPFWVWRVRFWRKLAPKKTLSLSMMMTKLLIPEPDTATSGRNNNMADHHHHQQQQQQRPSIERKQHPHPGRYHRWYRCCWPSSISSSQLSAILILSLFYLWMAMATVEGRRSSNSMKQQHSTTTTTSTALDSNNKEKCDLKKADRCTQILYIYGDPSYHMSNTVPEAEQFCNATREAEHCVRTYANNCVKPFARQYINLMIAGPVHLLRKRCSFNGIKKYLEHKDCINATKPYIDVCNDNAIRDTMRILKTRKDKWIPLSCCYISKSNQCSTEAINGESRCDEKSRQYMKEAIKVFSGEVFDLFCGNDLQWGQPACHRITQNLRQDIGDDKPLSVLPIVLEMMEQF